MGNQRFQLLASFSNQCVSPKRNSKTIGQGNFISLKTGDLVKRDERWRGKQFKRSEMPLVLSTAMAASTDYKGKHHLGKAWRLVRQVEGTFLWAGARTVSRDAASTVAARKRTFGGRGVRLAEPGTAPRLAPLKAWRKSSRLAVPPVRQER